MKIVVIGTRGIPNIQGGVETHCEELFPRISKLGDYDITIIRRTPYLTTNNKDLKSFNGVNLIDVYAPKKKAFEAIIHSILAVFKAKKLGADILHIHAIGPCMVTPLAKLLGMTVISTNHGPDYDRGKWGKMAKAMLKFGEKMSAKYSDKVIVISSLIRDILATKYNRCDTSLIFNGVNTPIKSQSTDYLESLGLQKGKYIVGLGRFVKEKGFHDLITAFSKANLKDFKLVIAGDADHEDDYSLSLKRQASENGVVLTGFIKGEKLNQLMSNAAIFAMPSYHEGLPIALLEALSYNLDIIVSDIPANKLSCLEQQDFFETGNVDDLTRIIEMKCSKEILKRTFDLTPYNWDEIAKQTAEVYDEVYNAKKHKKHSN